MSAQEYYNDSIYPGHGSGHANQGPMPPAGYPAYPPAAAAFPPSANDTAYSSHNGSGYQYQPQDYYGGHQQPPPPYYQHPEPPAPAQAPYSYPYPPQQQQPQQPYPQVTDQDVHAHQDNNDRGVLGALTGGAAGGYAGHQVNHGVLGTIGGAIAGSLAEDAMKKHSSNEKVDRRERMWGLHRRRFAGPLLLSQRRSMGRFQL